MKKTLFLACVLWSGLAGAGQVSVGNADEFQAAWAEASAGDTITITDKVDLSELGSPLADKAGVTVIAQEGGFITWSKTDQAASLPEGIQLQGISLINAPGTVLQGSWKVGENVSFIQSQGGDTVLVVEKEGWADIGPGARFENLVATGQGGALRVEDGASITVQGGACFANNVSQGLGGAIAVADQTDPLAEGSYHLVLDAENADILFSGNQSEAREREAGEWTGNPNDIYLGENASLRLNAAEGRSIKLEGGVESAASATIVKTGEGSVLLGEGSWYEGALDVQEGSVTIAKEAIWGNDEADKSSVTVREGAALMVEETATLSSKSVKLEKGAALALKGGVLGNEGNGQTVEMAGAVLIIEAPSTINSSTLTLKGANTWSFRMTDELLKNATGDPLLQFSGGTSINQEGTGSLTLNVDFRNATSTRGVDKIHVVNGTVMNEDALDILQKAPVTCTDTQGTHATTAAVDAEGYLDVAALVPHIRFDRPGRAAVNALQTSAGALRSLDAALHGQMPLHLTRQASPQVWGSALGYYDNATSAYRYSGGGYAVGATYAVGDSAEGAYTLAGIAIGQMFGTNKARLDGDSDANAKTDQHTLMLALYGRHAWGPTPLGSPALDVTLAYGFTDNDYSSATHRSSWDDNAFHAAARFSWELRQEDGTCITPFMGLEYTTASQDAATFTGTPGSWRSEGADLGVLSLPIGVAIHRSFEAGDGKIFTPQLELLYRGDLYRDTPSATMTDGYATWVSDGASPARSTFEARGTLHLQITDAWAAWATGSLETRSERTTVRFSVGTSYAF